MKKKIFILFLALFLVFLAGIFIALRMVFLATSNLDSLVALHKVEIIRQELVINVQTVQANLYTTGTLFGKELDDIVDNVLKLRAAVNNCGSCHHEPPVDDGVRELQELTEHYKEALSYFITSTADRDRIERLQSVAADIGDSIIAESQRMASTANENLRLRTMEAIAGVNRTKKILAMTIVLSFFLSLAIAVYLIKSITRPVTELIQATRKIKGGELGYTSTYPGQDEFGELIASFNDMSHTLKTTNEEILGHMARNQAILQTSIDGFLLFDEKGKILDVNPALSAMLGYSEAELLNMKFTDIEALGSKFAADNLLDRIKKARSLVFQTDQVTKEGHLTTVEISVTFVELDGVGNFFCFIRDITERKKMEEELLKIQKLESLGILAGGLAHDFNNLLTGIQGAIDLAITRINPNEKTYGWLVGAKKASRRAVNLTQQLLTFSKGGLPVTQPVAVAGLIEESTRFVLSGSNVKCRYHFPEGLYQVEADKGQTSQVFQNITLNAKQAMPEGGTLSITAANVEVEDTDLLPLQKGSYVRIDFADEGVGIPEKYITKIFDPYFTTKQAGNGLGLSICHSIINKHHGHIAVESMVNAGTTFTIYLPALIKEEVSEAVPLENTMITGTGRVLVMDDEGHLCETASEMLRHLGYEPDTAQDGTVAIELYMNAKEVGRPYAAVIMDLTIPGGMGGKIAIEKLRQFDPEVKALVSSGYSNDPVMAQYRKHGFSGVVSKPYDLTELGRMLHAILRN